MLLSTSYVSAFIQLCCLTTSYQNFLQSACIFSIIKSSQAICSSFNCTHDYHLFQSNSLFCKSLIILMWIILSYMNNDVNNHDVVVNINCKHSKPHGLKDNINNDMYEDNVLICIKRDSGWVQHIVLSLKICWPSV